MPEKTINLTKYNNYVSLSILYQFIVNLFGLIILLKVVSELSLDLIWIYIFWTLFSAATELKPITMPSQDQLTVSFAVHMSVLFLFGLPTAILISTVSNIFIDIYGRRGIKKLLFNVNQYAISIYVSWCVYQYLLPFNHFIDNKYNFAAMIFSCLAYVIINYLLVSTVISLEIGRKLFFEFTKDVKLELLHFATLVPVSLLIVILYNVEPLSIVIAILPLAMAHFSFDNYITLRTETKATIEVLADTIDKRDSYTAQHSFRVAKYSERIARELQLNPNDIENIITAARVHDLGKISISDSVLLKNNGLSQEERERMLCHSMEGYRIIKNLRFYKSGAKIVLHHHERYDGGGYPGGLKGDSIPIGARILAVADSYDAMTTDRPYRKALSEKEALDELIKCSGTQFDPLVVEAFLRVKKNDGLD